MLPPSGSLLGVPGRRSARGWPVVQLDHDEEMGPLYGMYGTFDAELEAQRTITRAEPTDVFVLTRENFVGLSMVHTLITKGPFVD